jgi:hypothetical protein
MLSKYFLAATRIREIRSGPAGVFLEGFASGMPQPRSSRRFCFHALGAWLVDLKHVQAGGDLRPSLGESVQARSPDDVLGDTAIADLLDDQVLDEACAG